MRWFLGLFSTLMIFVWPSSLRVAWPLPRQQAKLKELIPLASWQKEFKIIEGKDRGKVISLVSQPDVADAKRWQLVFGDYAAILLRNDPRGALMMERLDSFKSRSYIGLRNAAAGLSSICSA